MALGILKFRVRSPDRDNARDAARSSEVEAAIKEAIESVTYELNGLEKRVNAAFGAAAHLLDNSAEYSTRDPRDEAEIVRYEESAAAGLKRLDDLRKQRESYIDLLGQLKRITQI